MGLSVAAIGTVFLVGGLLQAIGTTDRFLPLSVDKLWSSPYGFLGFLFTILGIVLLLVGLILAVHYASYRTWYSNALKEKYRLKEEELRAQRKTHDKKPQTI